MLFSSVVLVWCISFSFSYAMVIILVLVIVITSKLHFSFSFSFIFSYSLIHQTLSNNVKTIKPSKLRTSE